MVSGSRPVTVAGAPLPLRVPLRRPGFVAALVRRAFAPEDAVQEFVGTRFARVTVAFKSRRRLECTLGSMAVAGFVSRGGFRRGLEVVLPDPRSCPFTFLRISLYLWSRELRRPVHVHGDALFAALQFVALALPQRFLSRCGAVGEWHSFWPRCWVDWAVGVRASESLSMTRGRGRL